MFIIPSGNASCKTSSPCQNGKDQQNNIANTGEDMEERDPTFTVGIIVDCCSHYGNQHW